jgi:glutathione S-transferase
MDRESTPIHPPEDPVMKLYYHPISTYSQKVMIAFNEKGIPYEGQFVDVMSPEGRAAYEKAYPIAKVPFLKPGDDYQVPESTSIIEYLEDKFPATPHLIPAAGGDAARHVRFIDRQADLYLNDPVVELLRQKFGLAPQDSERAARARRYLSYTYQYFDRRVAKQTWLCGETFTMADCAAIPPLYFAREVMAFDAYPNIVAYWQRSLKRPSYVKVKAEFEPIWKSMVTQRSAA